MQNAHSNRYEYLKGKDAWRNNLRLTTLAADCIRSSFGPNGSYKMVTYHRGPENIVKVTKDSVPILEELAVKYPTLVVLSEAAKLQRQEYGDGVKTFIILSAELLRKADALVAFGVHPATIVDGYEKATQKALELINSLAQSIPKEKVATFLESIDCGRGCLTPELRGLLLDVLELSQEKIRIIRKPGGSQLDTSLVKGIVVKKAKLHPNMPNSVQKPRIALSSERIGNNRLEIKMPGQGPFHMKFEISEGEDVAACRHVEEQRKIDALGKLQKFGVNVLFCQQPVDLYSKGRLLADRILAFDSVDREDLAMISKATGAKVIGPLSDLEETDVGIAANLETDQIGLEKTVTLGGCGFATFLVRGSNPQVIDELELTIKNSITLLRTAKTLGNIVAGGGALEMQVAKGLQAFALLFEGKEQLAINAFAEAVYELPTCLCVNYGLDPIEAMAQLKSVHVEGRSEFGFSAEGNIARACVDVAEVKRASLRRAFDVVSMMLRIDEQVIVKDVPKFHKQLGS